MLNKEVLTFSTLIGGIYIYIFLSVRQWLVMAVMTYSLQLYCEISSPDTQHSGQQPATASTSLGMEILHSN